jgi:hypothetical protein
MLGKPSTSNSITMTEVAMQHRYTGNKTEIKEHCIASPDLGTNRFHLQYNTHPFQKHEVNHMAYMIAAKTSKIPSKREDAPLQLLNYQS